MVQSSADMTFGVSWVLCLSNDITDATTRRFSQGLPQRGVRYRQVRLRNHGGEIVGIPSRTRTSESTTVRLNDISTNDYTAEVHPMFPGNSRAVAGFHENGISIWIAQGSMMGESRRWCSETLLYLRTIIVSNNLHPKAMILQMRPRLGTRQSTRSRIHP